MIQHEIYQNLCRPPQTMSNSWLYKSEMRMDDWRQVSYKLMRWTEFELNTRVLCGLYRMPECVSVEEIRFEVLSDGSRQPGTRMLM
jgi:hypothetical protein